jgi:hypothetical protein
MNVRVFFAWYDLWVGAFYERKARILYVCPLPCVVVRVSWSLDTEGDNG